MSNGDRLGQLTSHRALAGAASVAAAKILLEPGEFAAARKPNSDRTPLVEGSESVRTVGWYISLEIFHLNGHNLLLSSIEEDVLKGQKLWHCNTNG